MTVSKVVNVDHEVAVAVGFKADGDLGEDRIRPIEKLCRDAEVFSALGEESALKSL